MKIKFYYKLLKHFGFRSAWFLLISKFRRNKQSGIKIRGIKHPLTLSNFGVDVRTLFQIFFKKEYQIKELTSAEFIIDCGANIGLSAVYFANKFPNAKIIAIEPDKENFRVLKINAAPYKNIECLEMAVWPTETSLELSDPGIGSWGYQTKASLNGNIKAITIDRILELNGMKQIDLLKIDIEGGEEALFSTNYQEWLSKTKTIAIELHEFLKPGVATNFYQAISSYDYEMYGNGENLICVRKNGDGR